MTENKENTSEEKEPMLQKKKWLLISFCSVALLGGGVVYGIYNNQPNNQANQKIEQTDSSSKQSKKSSSAWEEQVAPEKGKKTKKSQSTDDVLNMVVGDKNDNSLFGVESPSMEDNQVLVDKIAVALDDQSKKEDARKMAEVARAAEVSSTKGNDSELIKVQIPAEQEEGNLEKDSDSTHGSKTNPLSNLTPDTESPSIQDPASNPDSNQEPNPDLNPDLNPDPNPNPTPDIDFNPTPDPDSVPSIDELIAQSKNELATAKEKADEVNSRLERVQSDLENLKTIDTTNQTKADKVTKELDKVRRLIAEYNELSDQLKQLIIEDGNISDVNLDLYKETYGQLNQKVTEIKDAQTSANEIINDMNTLLKNVEDTLNHIDATKEIYKNTQEDVTNTTNEVNNAIENANRIVQVASAVQPEKDQTIDSSNTMNTTNDVVGQQLDQLDETQIKASINSANETAQSVNDQATVQSVTVSEVVDEFNKFSNLETANGAELLTVQEKQTSDTNTSQIIRSDQTTTVE